MDLIYRLSVARRDNDASIEIVYMPPTTPEEIQSYHATGQPDLMTGDRGEDMYTTLMEVVHFDETLLPPSMTGLKKTLSIRSRRSLKEPAVIVDLGGNSALTLSMDRPQSNGGPGILGRENRHLRPFQ